jgi:hypothetical protein
MLSQLTVNSAGAFSGKLLLNGESYSLTGSFDATGSAGALVSRPDFKGGPVKVEMTLDRDSGQINGAVSGSGEDKWTSTLFAEAAATIQSSGEFELLLVPSANNGVPSGNGYLLLTNRFGQLTYAGALADGAPVGQTVPLGRLGDVPLFANLYGNTGLMLGWAGFSNEALQGETPLVWIKPATTAGPFADGFTNLLSMIAARRTKAQSNTNVSAPAVAPH